MGPLPLSPQIMFDLYLMCCVWDWEHACKKAGRAEGDTVRPAVKETEFQRLIRLGPGAEKTEPESSPFKYHRTTFDKVFRILLGMQLITELQVKSMQNDRDLQNMLYRKCSQKHSSDPDRHDLVGTKEVLIRHQDMSAVVNKKRLTRDTYYYPTAHGQAEGRLVAERYKDRITKEAYRSEVEKQEVEKPKGGAVYKRYREKVKAESGK